MSNHEAVTMSDYTPETPTKTCPKCQRVLPATTEYFLYRSDRPSGLRPRCKDCTRKERTTPEAKAHAKEVYAKYYGRPEIKQKTAERQKIYRRRPEVKEQRNKYDQEYRARPGVAEHMRAGFKTRYQNPEFKQRSNLRYHRYIARKFGLPDNFNSQDWQHVVDYFHGCCAVCGRQANDLFGTHTLAADHWIPLTSPDCPGTVPWNIVPLCHGLGGCNNQKHNADPVVWLTQKLGKPRAAKKLAEIAAFFETVRKV
jgi:hypothetical protein